MAQAFDSRSLFNDATWSDVTIKFSGREIKCHKIIICNGSDYFKALCGRTCKFKESESSTIELHDDAPAAVETVLRFIYNFTYSEIQSRLEDFTPKYHMGVIAAAKKYLLFPLEIEAIKGLDIAIAMVEGRYTKNKDANEMLDVMMELSNHKDHRPSFVETITDLAKIHMSKLFKIDRFRGWIETDNGEPALDLTKRAIEWGARLLEATDWEGPKVEKINVCRYANCIAFGCWQKGPTNFSTCTQCGRRFSEFHSDLIVVLGKPSKVWHNATHRSSAA